MMFKELIDRISHEPPERWNALILDFCITAMIRFMVWRAIAEEMRAFDWEWFTEIQSR